MAQRNDITELLELDNEPDQKTWLQAYYPERSDELITSLEGEIQQRFRENPQTARSIVSLFLWIGEQWQDPEIEIDSLYWLACTDYFLANHREALDIFTTAANRYRALQKEYKVARTAVGQLNVMLYLGLYQDGLEIAEQAEPVLKEHDDLESLAKLYSNQANIYVRLGRFSEALENFQAARTIFIDQNNAIHAAFAQMNIANIQMTLDEFPQAAENYSAARQIFAANDLTHLLAMIDHNMAELTFYQGEYQQALRLFDLARQSYVAQENLVDAAYADLFRSEVYLSLNLWHEAVELAQEARSHFLTADMNWEAGRLWLNEGVAQAHLGNHDAAQQLLSLARNKFQAEENELWQGFTDLYAAVFAYRQADYTLAGSYGSQALSVFRACGLASRSAEALVLLGKIALAIDQLDTAVNRLNQANAELNGIQLPALTYAINDALGQWAEQSGQNEQARIFYREAIQAIEQLQATIGAEDYKIAFLSDKLRTYEAHILLCLEAEEAQEAFATIEQAKSRALLDLIIRDVTYANTADDDLLAELNQLKRELNWYYNRLNGNGDTDSNERSPQQRAELTQTIATKEQAYKQLWQRWQMRDTAVFEQHPAWTITLNAFQQTLDEETLVLEFFATAEQMIVFGVTHNSNWQTQIDCTPAEINSLLSQFRFQINKFVYGKSYISRHAPRLLDSTNTLLQQLYQKLIHPIQQHLNRPHLVIIPHKALHYIPFHALFDGEQYLIDTHTISYAPSATVLHQLRKRPITKSSGQPLVMGLADQQIPFAQQEAETIAQKLAHATLFTGEEATSANLKSHLADAPLLHLSTHAMFRADNPMFSALKMSDGWVSVNDLYNIASVPPLVVLSACETGRNQITTGDELLGLSRGLFAGGAHTLVVSLWMADDETTAALMSAFYNAYQAGQPIHQALRTAQLCVKQQQPHPYYWSPFIVNGNANSLAVDHGLGEQNPIA